MGAKEVVNDRRLKTAFSRTLTTYERRYVLITMGSLLIYIPKCILKMQFKWNVKIKAIGLFILVKLVWKMKYSTCVTEIQSIANEISFGVSDRDKKSLMISVCCELAFEASHNKKLCWKSQLFWTSCRDPLCVVSSNSKKFCNALVAKIITAY